MPLWQMTIYRPYGNDFTMRNMCCNALYAVHVNSKQTIICEIYKVCTTGNENQKKWDKYMQAISRVVELTWNDSVNLGILEAVPSRNV